MRLVSLLFAVAIGVAGCTTTGPKLPPPPTPAEIVQMAKDGVPAKEIIQRIDALQGVYPLPASELAKLRDQGVPDEVIDYMQRTYIQAVRADEYWRIRELYFPYGPGYIGPYPYGYPVWGWR